MQQAHSRKMNNCIDKTVLEERVKRLTLARFAALIELQAAAPPHSPGALAGGWYMKEIYRSDGSHYHGGTRHKLETSASMSMSGDTITVNLIYTILDA